ncbi:MAG TPA: hypothetical protein VI958_06615, partial [Acidobacteriota bacterium]
MRPLDSVRNGWNELAAEEEKIDRALTIEESVRIYLCLIQTYSPFILQTQDLFRREREEYLSTLQQRLKRLRF